MTPAEQTRAAAGAATAACSSSSSSSSSSALGVRSRSGLNAAAPRQAAGGQHDAETGSEAGSTAGRSAGLLTVLHLDTDTLVHPMHVSDTARSIEHRSFPGRALGNHARAPVQRMAVNWQASHQSLGLVRPALQMA